MAPYDEWTQKLEDGEEEELQDASAYEMKRDVILFCIDASESMLKPYDDSRYENVQTCHLFTALEAAVQIQKKKIITGPNDSVGILLYNTTKKSEADRNHSPELKNNIFLYQPISPLSAPKVQEVLQLLEAAREDLDELKAMFPPLKGRDTPMGDVFTSCNWVLRDGAPKTASKRVFLITDNDNPASSTGRQQLMTSARTTLIDLTRTGVTVEPFFISTEDNPFDLQKFYSSVLIPTNTIDEEELEASSSVLPESISIAKIEDLLAQMRFHEIPKRAIFSVPFQLANGFTIGVKGYGLVTEQKKGTYKYFMDTGDDMVEATSRTIYVDEGQETEVDKSRFMFGGDLGGGSSTDDGDEGDSTTVGFGTRVVESGKRPFFTAEEIRKFRTMDLEPGIKLLGFKDMGELAFEDNVKHSQFIYPDEMFYSGSKRTFGALLKSMVNKKKIGIVLCLTRRNDTPVFCALYPQEEKEKDGWTEPPGFHLIQFPFADDIRGPPIEEGFRASKELEDLAGEWIQKISLRNGSYPYDAYPNPALAYHNEQLEASAFGEEYDPESFEDSTEPKVATMHKRAGKLMKAWKDAVAMDPTATYAVPTTTGSKRKATAEDPTFDISEVQQHYEDGALAKLRVDQLKEFLKAKGLTSSGKKADLIERVADWFASH